MSSLYFPRSLPECCKASSLVIKPDISHHSWPVLEIVITLSSSLAGVLMLTGLTRTCLSCFTVTCSVMAWRGGSKYSISPLYYLQPLQTLPGQDWSKPWCPRYNTSVNTSLYVVITTTNRDLPVKAVISALLILTLRSSPTITKLFMALSLDLFCKTAGCTTGQ